MAGFARAEYLGPRWLRLAVVAAAFAAVVAAMVAGIPLGWALLLAALVGWLVASALYVTAPVIFGRAVGLLAALAAGMALVLPGSLVWLALVPIAVGVIVLLLRLRGVRSVDAVTPDRTFVPFLFDEGDRLVDTLDAVWGSTRAGGPREGLRAAHSHGSVLSGQWERDSTHDPAPERMPLFGHSSGTVVARFSNFSGVLERDDQRRTVHGLALELQASGEASFVMVLVDIRRFPVATRDDFVALTRCLRSVGPRRWWSTTKLIVTGRTSFIALSDSRLRRRIESYAERTYNGLNAFTCTLNADTEPVPVRYLATPVGPTPRPIGHASVALPRTRLDDELHARIRAGIPVRFDIELVLGRRRNGKNVSADRARDPTHAWSKHSPTVRLCTVTLDRYVTVRGPDRLLFQPFDVPHGLQPSDDEILSARRTAYAASYLRRCPLDEVSP